ncbi:MAG: HAD-IIB family hydrolase [Ruminococcaceae bacterium]|nr:HAD-IIB family hydrolase [Oscillospiraceae bacterium]
MTEKKYLFFDLDSTISFDSESVEEETLVYLKRLKEEGHELIINTGRGLSHISKRILDAIEWDGIIAGAGYMEYKGEVLFNHPIPQDTVLKLYKYCMEKNAAGIFEGVHTLYTSHPYPVTQILINEENIGEVKDISCITVVTSIEKKEADTLFPELTTVIMPRYFEGYPKGFSKATGLIELTKRFGISPDDMIAFGDSENDESMLRYAGTSVVIGDMPKGFDSFASMNKQSVAEGIKSLFNL